MPLKADFSAALKINEILPVALVLIGVPPGGYRAICSGYRRNRTGKLCR
ncbi:MAG: hypothetical protein WAT53_06760 [Nitrosomonas sp.]